MSHTRRKQLSRLSVGLIGSLLMITGCGVRGRPQPPLTPAELGRGQPTFKRTTEEFAFPNVPSPDAPAPTPVPAKKSGTNSYGN